MRSRGPYPKEWGSFGSPRFARKFEQMKQWSMAFGVVLGGASMRRAWSDLLAESDREVERLRWAIYALEDFFDLLRACAS